MAEMNWQEEMAKRYPCQEIPLGHITQLAAEFGVSKQRVSQVAKKLGLTSRKFEAQITNRVCGNCGQPLQKHKQLCHDCLYVTLACDICGRLFERLRSVAVARNERFKGVYCSHECYGVWWSEHHWKRK